MISEAYDKSTSKWILKNWRSSLVNCYLSYDAGHWEANINDSGNAGVFGKFATGS